MRQELVIHDAKLTAKLDRLGRAAKQAHDRVRKCAIKAVENMVLSGQALCKARDLCDTEEWDNFIDKYFGKAESTARTYMKLARNWPVLQAVAPPEALTSQRKALRLLNSLVLGEKPPSQAVGQPRKKRKKAAALEVVSASTDLSHDECAASLRRMYQEMLGVISDVTKNLSEARPINFHVSNAIDSLRRARSEFVVRGEKLFPSQATPADASDMTSVVDSEARQSQNLQNAITADPDDNP